MPGPNRQDFPLTTWMGELRAEFDTQSDRGLAIVGAAVLDEMLRLVLVGFLVPDKRIIDYLFGVDRPLGSFSGKIKMAYSLGLISKSEYRALETIRDIRNDFAHQLGGISFATQSVRDRCANLALPASRYVPDPFPLT